MSGACLLSHALFQCVTDLAKMFTVHFLSGLATRAKYKHVRTMCAHTGTSSSVLLKSSELN